jgi:hypothetical protein
MKTLAAMIMCASIGLPFTAFAQSSDMAYCNALSETYRNVVGSNAATDGGVAEAMANCKTTPGTAIPVLEKVLTDNKVTLPKRI